MIYRVIGLMSGPSDEGLDIVFAELHENGGKWGYEILNSESVRYPEALAAKLDKAIHLDALEYQLLHIEFGHYLGTAVNRFIQDHELQFKVALIASGGYRTFHVPAKKLSAQLGEGASIAAVTRLPVVTDFGVIDMALGGQGGPLGPVAEQLLFGSEHYFLHLGENATLSMWEVTRGLISFDVCPVNSVLKKAFTNESQGKVDLAETNPQGQPQAALLEKLNSLSYYDQAIPKSLTHDYSEEFVSPVLREMGYTLPDVLATYTAHIAAQVRNAFLLAGLTRNAEARVIVTGNGALNHHLVGQISAALQDIDVKVTIPVKTLVRYKEALTIALMGVLRWREEINMQHSATGASEDSVGGAMWMGQEP